MYKRTCKLESCSKRFETNYLPEYFCSPVCELTWCKENPDLNTRCGSQMVKLKERAEACWQNYWLSKPLIARVN